MIIYDEKSTLEILRLRGSVLTIDLRLWVSLGLTTILSLFVTFHEPTRVFLMQYPGKGYLGIIGKVLVFLLVFRSKLTYERFWKARKAMEKMHGGMLLLSQDLGAFSSNGLLDDPEAHKLIGEIYRLGVATFVAMQVHIRKNPDELRAIHDRTFEAQAERNKQKVEQDKSAPIDVDAVGEGDHFRLKQMELDGILTEDELKACLNSGLEYVNILSTRYAARLRTSMQKGYLHRNLTQDLDKHMSNMIHGWHDAEVISFFPFPFPFVQALLVFLYLFIFTLPPALVSSMGFWTPVVTPLIVLGFCGLDAVSAELEDPFGFDDNDLPLDAWAQSTVNAGRLSFFSAKELKGPNADRVDRGVPSLNVSNSIGPVENLQALAAY